MNVTVCQLNDDPQLLERDWQRLVEHVRAQGSDLVLLPEMPFYPWLARSAEFDLETWNAAVQAHVRWQEERFPELAPAVVLGSSPVTRGGRRLNEGFVWTAEHGARPAHAKRYLPNEEGFYEASWYQRGDATFTPVEVGKLKIGFLICSELWFGEHARAYGKAGAHLLVCPRATPASSADKWVAGGRAAAVVSGAYCLSSNRGGRDSHGTAWAGRGWVVEPEEGDVLALTSEARPFATVEIDPTVADQAKRTYPRYIQV